MTPNIQTHDLDIIIIGGGGAGLMAAVHASKSDKRVACLAKTSPLHSHTVAAQGGINASLRPDDHFRWHAYDTLKGSDWLADSDTVTVLCERAKSAILELEHMGVAFTRQGDGTLYQRIYGGQSTDFGKSPPVPRACAAADRTGHAILHTLYQQCIRQNVQFLYPYYALDLVVHDHTCHGVLVWNVDAGQLEYLQSKAIILATGGYGQCYQHTTASSICTGDGIAMALRAGLPCQDMEFVQFHPTGLYPSGFLITEAARGEGGYLINGQGEQFMERYAPTYKDLASRDIIARAIAQEISEGRGAGESKDHVLLCLQHLDPHMVEHQLPTVMETSKQFANIDPHKDPIPVIPSTHYTMGGIPTNANTQVLTQTSDVVDGLFAIGENACASVHGANRLGCNGLLELIVFGKEAGKQAIEYSTTHPKSTHMLDQKLVEKFTETQHGKGDITSSDILQKLKDTMSSHVGVYRSQDPLQHALTTIDDLIIDSQHIGINDPSLIYNQSLQERLELDNLLLLAKATVTSALYRTESRGAHYRNDYPTRNDKLWRQHTSCVMGKNTKYKTKKIPVRTKSSDDIINGLSIDERAY